MTVVLRNTKAVAELGDAAAAMEEFRRSVLDGLAKAPKAMEAKFLYDDRGSQLFDAITELKEYYPTRAEVALLETHAPAIADFVGPGVSLIEFGSGSSVKTRILLDTLPDLRSYVPIDISGDHLKAAAQTLAEEYAVPVLPIHADYTRALDLPPAVPRGRRVGFFPGSTIGNFDPEAAVAFLRQARELLGAGGRFLVGVDLQKDPARLVAAYDDTQGVTAAFNLNLLRRINRELGGNFDVSAFRHKARYDIAKARIEMHLISLQAQRVEVAEQSFFLAAGESIHTENSYKYTLESFGTLSRRSGWHVAAQWRDPDGLFSLHGLVAD